MSYRSRYTGSARLEFPDKEAHGCEAVWEGSIPYTFQHLGVSQLFVLLQRFLESLRNQTIKHSDTRKDRRAQGDTHPKENAAQGTLGGALVI